MEAKNPEDPLNAEFSFERRKKILRALQYEFELEETEYQHLTAEVELLRQEADETEEQASRHERNAEALDDAMDFIIQSLTDEQQKLIENTTFSEFIAS